LFAPITLLAHLNIAVSYPYIGAITKAIGKDHVKTIVLAKGNWDPHFVVPRPSLISKLRGADALIMNGAQLEIGWLPPLIRRANNKKVVQKSKNFLNLAHYIPMIQKPTSVDRSQGDVHPEGNPHFHLDPNNITLIAQTVAAFLISIDSEHTSVYETNYNNFEKEWNQHLIRWEVAMRSYNNLQVIQYHDNLAYFNKAYNLKTIGVIEPLPGIPPSSKHTFQLISLIKKEKPRYIFHDVYHSTKTADYIHNKTGIKVIRMPHDIGALESITSLVGLFDYLTQAIATGDIH
jgi:zinc/manganese transport system substrate-binding protein